MLFTNPQPREDELRRCYSEDGPWAARRAERTSEIAASNARGLRKRFLAKALPRRSCALFDALARYVSVCDPPCGAEVGIGEFCGQTFADMSRAILVLLMAGLTYFARTEARTIAAR